MHLCICTYKHSLIIHIRSTLIPTHTGSKLPKNIMDAFESAEQVTIVSLHIITYTVVTVIKPTDYCNNL